MVRGLRVGVVPRQWGRRLADAATSQGHSKLPSTWFTWMGLLSASNS